MAVQLDSEASHALLVQTPDWPVNLYHCLSGDPQSRIRDIELMRASRGDPVCFAAVSAIFFFECIRTVQSLECFSCVSQEDNNEKCISTIQLCDPEIHDACSTNIRWGVPFFWVPAIKRMHYISKSCDNMRSCQTRKRQLEDRCYRDWWADWQCEDCCSGDRCNYYVVLASARSRMNGWLLAISVILPLAMLHPSP